MKHISMILLLIVTAFLLSSCYIENTDHQPFDYVGYLRIYNNTNASITVTWTANNSTDHISANSSKVFEFDMKSAITSPKGVSTTYTCDGLFLTEDTFTDYVILGQTTTRTLDPDRGCIDFINTTDGSVDVFIPSQEDQFTIGANSDYIYSFFLNNHSITASFDFSGDFVFTDSGTMNVNLNATRDYTISATGAAIKIRNLSPYPITEVNLAPQSDTSWGANDLTGTIEPGHYVIWTVVPNSWDVQAIDSHGSFEVWMNNDFIDLNQIMTLDYNPFGKSASTVSNKTKGIGSSHDGQFKIHQVGINMPIKLK